VNELEKFALSAEQETWLHRKLKRPGTAQIYRRATAILAVHNGRSPHEVAAVLGVTRQTVYNWLGCCDPNRPDLFLDDAPRAGRPGIGVGALDLLLKRALQLSPGEFGYECPRWTSALLRQHVVKSQGPDVSGETIRRRVRRLGFFWRNGAYVRRSKSEFADSVQV
jgi:transposase